MSTTVEKLVEKAIQNYERFPRTVPLTKPAKTMLASHANKHKRKMLLQLRTRKVTQRKLVKGLEDVLSYAAGQKVASKKLRKTARRARLGKPLTVGSARRGKMLSAQDVRTAMTRKCKTYPWC